MRVVKSETLGSIFLCNRADAQYIYRFRYYCRFG